MGVESIIIVSDSGIKLLSRHWNHNKSIESNLLTERKIAQHVLLYTSTPYRASIYSMHIDEYTVLSVPAGELTIYLSGSGQDGDEFILATVSDLVIRLLEEHLETKVPTCSLLLAPEAIGKMLVSLDELICDGELIGVDVDLILKLSKMKQP
jgi:hypothetical protein